MSKPRHTENQRRAIMEEIANGAKLKDVCKSYGISTSTYYLWKAKINSKEVASAKRAQGKKAKNSAFKSDHEAKEQASLIGRVQNETPPVYRPGGHGQMPESLHTQCKDLAGRLDEYARSNNAREIFQAPACARVYCVNRFEGHPAERFDCAWLDNRHKLIATETLFTGTINGASVYPREAARRALEVNAAAVILMHNHPSGEPEPSAADQKMTKRLTEVFDLFDIRVLDHLVYGGGEVISFAERGMI